MGLPRLANRLTRAAVTAILVVTAALASGTGAAWGYLSTTGAGTASSSLGTLQPPTNVTVPTESATGTVNVSWAASAGPLAPTGYFVTRITVSTGATADACGTSRTAPITALACSDVAVPMGTFTYLVTAVTRSWTAASTASGSIAVTHPLAQLAFTTQPAGATGGTAFTSQPVVALRDAAGETITANTSPVTLTITGSPAGVTLTCAANPPATVAGVATFSGCSIDKAGSYTLTATAGGFSTVSTTLTVTVGAAAKLAFSAQPTGSSAATGGSAFTIQPTVTVQDAGGNTVAGDTRLVSIALAAAPSPGGAVLTCTAKNAVAGVATFSGCLIDKIGTYALTATAPSVTAAITPATFTVTVGTAVRLGFTAQPTGGNSSVAFSPQPVVAIQDAGGNTVTGAPAAPVTLTFTPLANGNDLTCTTSNTRTSTGGVATFSGCNIKKAGTYQLVAAAPVFPNVSSALFTLN